jgi:hypothetical protein
LLFYNIYTKNNINSKIFCHILGIKLNKPSKKKKKQKSKKINKNKGIIIVGKEKDPLKD